MVKSETVQCINCRHLKKEWCKKIDGSPDEHRERECVCFKQKRNIDAIRQMTVKELAEFLCDKENGAYIFRIRLYARII